MWEINSVDYSVYRINAGEGIRVMSVGVAVSMLIMYLFYHNMLVCIVTGFPTAIVSLRLYRNYKVRQRKNRLATEFEEMLQSLSVALSTGYSLENAFDEAKKELLIMYPPSSPLITELEWICSSIRLNINVEELILNLANRSGIEEIYSFAEIIVIAKRSGGDLITIVMQTADMMHGKKEINEDIRTMVAARRFENRIMSIMPAGMLIYLWIFSPGYLSVLYGNIKGALVMTVCLIVYGVSYYWGSRIMNIESTIRCKRPYCKKVLNRGNHIRTAHNCKVYEYIHLRFYVRWFAKISQKAQAVYIDIKDYDVSRDYWMQWFNLIYLMITIGCVMVLYGLLADRSILPYILFLSVALIIGVPAGRVRQLDKLAESRNQQMLLDYSELISRFTLLLGAGINMKGAWIRIVGNYSNKRKDEKLSVHYIYEEMIISVREFQNGISERAVYEKFGRRIKLLPYMKFGTMLTQNLTKGNRSLLDQLKLTSLDALEQRRTAMKRLGEEASSKLLFPMMLQFVLILVIVMYPALVSL